MTYEYRVISASREPGRQGNDRRMLMPNSQDLEATLNELASEGYRFAAAVTWGVRRGDQVLIMEREGQPE